MVVRRRVRNRDRVVLARAKAPIPNRSAPKSSSCRRDDARKRRHDGQHQPDAAMARSSASSRPAMRASDLYLLHQLGHAAQEALRGLDRSEGPADSRPDLGLRARRRARARDRRTVGAQSAARDQRYLVEPASRGYACEQVAGFTDLKTTARPPAARWIYSGVVSRQDEPTRAIERATIGRRSAGASPGPPIGACSTIAPRRSRRQAVERAQEYMSWDEGGRRNGLVPTFPTSPRWEGAARRRRSRARSGLDAHSGADPFIMQARRPSAVVRDRGPQGRSVPAHYEPLESVVRNAVYPQQNNPALREWVRRDNAYNGPWTRRFPVRAHDVSADRALAAS